MTDHTTPQGMLSAALLERVIRESWDPLEVKVVLVAALLGADDVPVSELDVLAHEGLLRGARTDGSGRDPRERCLDALELAGARGVLLRLVSDDDTHWVLLGTDRNRRRVRVGLSAPTQGDGLPPRALHQERPGVFAVYEQNIGLVTPIIADQLVDALERYPEDWIIDAIGEAVGYNKRNWRYIQRILESWATEGRSNETHRGAATRDYDREKHLRGKYAELFHRERE